MIYRRRRNAGGAAGFYRLTGKGNQTVFGAGDGDFIRLHDEHGNQWFGSAERQSDNSLRFRFKDSSGKTISGISDGNAVVLLRDEKGNSWRGYID